VRLPRLGLGTNQFGRRVDLDGARRILDAALEEGVDFIDTAELYADGASESLIGQALEGRRERFKIATKFSPSNDPRHACEGSLKRLRTDYLDLYQMHFPNPDVPIQATLEALARLVEEGKVREVGSSNFAGWQIADADWIARSANLPRFVTAQNLYSLVERQAEAEVIPACRRFDVGLIAFLPLGGGLLSGKYRRGRPPPAGSRLSVSERAGHFLNDAMFDKVEALERFAGERELPLLAVALGGLASMPGVACVIAGATGADQVRANAAAARWQPSEEELEEIRRLTT
jgi:aryl-alcohol dehydrogenase-like predicted oxidoreductase